MHPAEYPVALEQSWKWKVTDIDYFEVDRSSSLHCAVRYFKCVSDASLVKSKRSENGINSMQNYEL